METFGGSGKRKRASKKAPAKAKHRKPSAEPRARSEHPTLWARAARVDRRLATGLIGALAIGLLGWAIDGAMSSKVFAVDRVVVSGVEGVRARQVEAFAALPPGTSLWSVDAQRVARRVRLLPWVRSVRVHRRLPATVTLTVSGHTTVAQGYLSDRLVLLDREGKPTGLATRPADLPVIQGATTYDELSLAMQAARAFERVRDGKELAAVELHALGVSVFDRAGVEFRLGRSRFVERLRIAERVRAEGSRRLASFDRMLLDDDRHPNRVVVRRAGR
jgi:cell division septal protein FtsQ